MSAPPIYRADIERNIKESVRIALNGHLGRFSLDVRIWADAKFGATTARVPTKRGVTLDARHIPDVIAALEGVRIEAERLGLLEEAR